jgi:hypothetical protein
VVVVVVVVKYQGEIIFKFKFVKKNLSGKGHQGGRGCSIYYIIPPPEYLTEIPDL